MDHERYRKHLSSISYGVCSERYTQKIDQIQTPAEGQGSVDLQLVTFIHKDVQITREEKGNKYPTNKEINRGQELPIDNGYDEPHNLTLNRHRIPRTVTRCKHPLRQEQEKLHLEKNIEVIKCFG